MYWPDLSGRLQKMVAASSNVSCGATTGISTMAITKNGQLKAHIVAGKVARQSMTNFIKNRPLTEEEQAIDAAIDDHQEARQDERKTFWLAVALYFVGLFVSAGTEDGSRQDNVGTALILCGLVVFGVHLWLGWRTTKKRLAVKELMDPYLRKKALPFYQELVEMFAEKPGIHLHLTENGTIVVTDRRKNDNAK